MINNRHHLELTNASLSLRSIELADEEVLKKMYSSTRRKEMELVPHWKASEKEAFLHQQFKAQHTHYQQQYKTANFWIIQKNTIPIGRLYLQIEYTTTSIGIIDITLLPEYRQQGLGAQILKDIIALGDTLGKSISIHVESFNPAMNLYKRLGFEVIGTTNQVYYLLERKSTKVIDSES